VRLASVLDLYRMRVRARLVQECFALAGIAAGVALLFAAQVSSSSLESSVAELSRGIAGRATLQLLARDPHGFPVGVLQRVRDIPGVLVAAPLLEAGANAIGPRGSESVQLVGADESLRALGGALVHDTELSPFGGVGAVVLPAPLARRIGVERFGAHVIFQVAGRRVKAPLYEQLSAAQIGPLSSSPVALAPLSFAQEMTGLRGRVTRILVQSAPGAEDRVKGALRAIADGRLNVEPIGYEQGLFATAAAASNQSTALFAAISAVVGFLFAFNAMLLTVPQRRRLIADLRRDGYPPRTVIAVLLSDAVALGLVACALGLALGEALSIYALHSNPAFLSLAFALGSQRVVTWQSVAVATSGGMLAAVVAVLSPLRDVLSGNPLAAIGPRESSSAASIGSSRARLAVLGVACLGAATLVLHSAPGAAIPAMVLLVAALVLVLPLALSATLALAERLAGTVKSAVPHVAVAELRVAGARAVAIAATGAIAVFGSVAIQGAHRDLLAGLERAARETNASSEIWVHPAGAYNLLNTTPFPPTQETRLEHLPGVRAVGIYRGGLLDYGQRRTLVIAPPPQATPLLPTGQIVQGNVAQATERVRAGGWVVLSEAIAEEHHHLRIGQSLTLPSPHPTTLRVAALSTNLGWAPGTIVMNATDYARAWESQDASTYGILLAPWVSPTGEIGEIERALGSASGLSAETSERHILRQDMVSREALARLGQIATLIPIVAVLAMAAAIGAMISQRRPRLAQLRLEGLPRSTLLGTILLEGAMLAGAGSLTGAAFGLYGQQLTDHVLSSAINFPIQHTVTAMPALASLALVIFPTLVILAIPGHLATRVPPALALAE
jgi:putative ABC transport system permease protein